MATSRGNQEKAGSLPTAFLVAAFTGIDAYLSLREFLTSRRASIYMLVGMVIAVFAK